MNVTKYPQSCLVLEKDGRRILIDPGSFMTGKFSSDDLPEIEAIFLTHRHPDHADPDFITAALAKKSVPVYANQDTKELLVDLVNKVIQPGQSVNVAGFSVRAYDMPHCLMVDGVSGPPNNGYVLDGRFLHAGDGITVDGLQVGAAAVAIAGPDISLKDAHDLIVNVGAKKIIPVHYSIFSDEKPQAAAGLVERVLPGAQLICLGNGQTVSM